MMHSKKRLWLHKVVIYRINPRELTGTKHWAFSRMD